MRSSLFVTFLISNVFAFGCSQVARADETEQESANESAGEHPLEALFEYVTERHGHVRGSINDYRCRIVKRERIDGRLQEYRYMNVMVRPKQMKRGGTETPFSVLMTFAGPEEMAGRIVLYVEGQNENKMLVRRGGKRFSYVTTKIALDSDLAKKESALSIVTIGFDTMADELARQIKDDMKADPTGENTQVEHLKGAKVNNRPCAHVRISHPKKAEGLEFYRASVFVDDEWRLPVRLEVYDWPKAEGEDPPLLGEFTYLDVKLNVGLKDSNFSPKVVMPREARRR